MQNENLSCSIGECHSLNTASTLNTSDVSTVSAVETACARGSVLLITYFEVLVYQYVHVQGHCLPLETSVSVQAWDSHERILSGAVSYNIL